ncbi:MAG: ParA family protein [Gammaproteobacteria bacterium]|nr:ParA family protein [Gammaproteobacteria bacterium]
MKVWAVANQKGGVGKTTTVVNLAGPLAVVGRSVLLLDLDPHGSLTSYFGLNPDTIEHSVYGLFGDDPTEQDKVIVKTPVENLDLIPASSAMATLDRQLGVQAGKGLVVSQVLKTFSDRYDYVLMDCPPVLGILMVNALAACQRLIIPVQTEYLALKGLERIVNTLDMVSKSRQDKLPYLIVPTMFDARTRASNDSLEILQHQFPNELWDGFIPVDTRFRDASAQHMPLTLSFPKARGAIAYRKLLQTLLKSEVRQTPHRWANAS